MTAAPTILKFEPKTDGVSASLPAPQKSPNFKFERKDWELFRSVGTLPQVAGVPKALLRRLVLKELTDNALDASADAKVQVGQKQFYITPLYSVRDNGPGIDGTPEDIARLFSINRPLVSSKLWRMPQRGALGNGLRVVAGAVAASNGWLRVSTRNQRMVLTPQEDGSTSVTTEICDFPFGTLIEVVFGPEIPDDPAALKWALAATRMTCGSTYTGNTSAHWYDGDAFFDILRASGDRLVREFVANLDGCTGAKAGIVSAQFKGRTCGSLGRDEAIALLMLARDQSKPVRPERLGAVGPLPWFGGYAYACRKDSVLLGGRVPKAGIPFVVEAWAIVSVNGAARMFVNRTPITGDIRAYFKKTEMSLYGCDLALGIKVPRDKQFDVVINITTPYCPITTSGKEPDLSAFDDEIIEAVQKAINGARRAMPRTPSDERQTQKSVVLANLDNAIDKASGDRQFRFSPRQVYYVLRPIVHEKLGAELSYGNFEQIVTDYESEHGDIPLMYRDPRGTLYHPHLGENIALGTMAVEKYDRPAWTFNKVLYIEKEGFFEALKAVNWPEEHDCALLTSKGFSTRAVRDLLDHLGDDESEPVQVFCVHDADGSGSLIYQTLQEATKARPRRRVEIVNLGLEPWEAIEMGLQVEIIKDSDRDLPVADYISDRPDGDHWKAWLQTNRIELNAMSTPKFLEWLNRKITEYDVGKVTPPPATIEEMLQAQIEYRMREQITEQILRDANIDDLVASALEAIDPVDSAEYEVALRAWFEEHRDRNWKDWVDELASDVVGRAQEQSSPTP
jgi:hypothetical protein